jgi:hypothetical protein
LTIALQNRAVNTYTPLRLPLEEEPISPRPNPEWSETEIRRLLVEAEMGAHAWAIEQETDATTPESQPTSTRSPRMGVAAALTILAVITALALLARP